MCSINVDWRSYTVERKLLSYTHSKSVEQLVYVDYHRNKFHL